MNYEKKIKKLTEKINFIDEQREKLWIGENEVN